MMRQLYSLLLYLLMPLILIRLLLLSMRNPAYRQRWSERFGRLRPSDGDPVIWIHAVSVGEVQAATPIIHRLLQDYPQLPLLVTTTTPTGSDTVRRLFAGQVRHSYLPYDLPGSIQRFLQRSRPRLLLTMETELWPNLFHYCYQADIPIYVANARLSARSARGYQRFPKLVRPLLARVKGILAQHDSDRQRFVEIGAAPNRVAVTGSLKFDVRLPAGVRESGEALRHALGAGRPVWVAASTHAGEELQLLQIQQQLRQQFAELLLILVPRHPQRFDEVARLCQEAGAPLVRRSSGADVEDSTSVYLVDSMGELPIACAAADLAFVGGSLVPIGGHNVLEPAAIGLPVLVGPYTHNFSAIVKMLRAADACIQVTDAAELRHQVAALLSNANLRFQRGQQARACVERNRGAVDRVMNYLHEELSARHD